MHGKAVCLLLRLASHESINLCFSSRWKLLFIVDMGATKLPAGAPNIKSQREELTVWGTEQAGTKVRLIFLMTYISTRGAMKPPTAIQAQSETHSFAD